MTYRLSRLHRLDLVDRTRPYVSAGSAPLHWWLTAKGVGVVTGSPVSRRSGDCRPKPMFLAHSAAIADLWVALVLEGPSIGFSVVGWKRDEEGWEDWGGRNSGGRITPDAVATLRIDDFDVDVFLEVDLATMTHTRLKAKAARYMAYAKSEAWRSRHVTCPTLAFLTTSEQRASTFLAGIDKLRDKPSQWDEDADDAGLLVTACAFVRDPATAVTERVWRSTRDDDDLDFMGLLSPHVAIQRVQEAKERFEAAEADRLAPVTALNAMQYLSDDLEWRHSQRDEHLGLAMAAKLAHLKKTGAVFDWAMTNRSFVLELAAWYDENRQTSRYKTVPVPAPLVRQLRVIAGEVHERQSRALAGAIDAIARRDPNHLVLTKRVANGDILAEYDLERLGSHLEDGRKIQAEALGDYVEKRHRAMESARQRLSRLQRRHFEAEVFMADYDAAHLVICKECEIYRPKTDWQDRTCPQCRRGQLVAFVGLHE